jgi:hypothetical protein
MTVCVLAYKHICRWGEWKLIQLIMGRYGDLVIFVTRSPGKAYRLGQPWISGERSPALALG